MFRNSSASMKLQRKFSMRNVFLILIQYLIDSQTIGAVDWKSYSIKIDI